ncbi:MAG: hypothetical protein AAFY08_14535 [Planctomycetota bacterium]
MGVSPDTPLDQITSLTAAGRVDLELLDQNLALAGDRLVVDADDDQAELFGDPLDPDRWATATQTDDRGPSTLAGPQLVFRQADRSARVPGPGTLTTPLPTDQSPDRQIAKSPSQLAVAWQRGMAFFDTAGQAHFIGNVTATTQQPNATSQLTADDLRLNFTPYTDEHTAIDPNTPQANREPSDRLGPQPPNRDIAKSPNQQRQLLTASATSPAGDTPPAFTYAARDPDTDQLLTRLTLQGDALNLDNTNADQPTLTVPSPGRLLLEDYRPNAASEPREDAGPTDPLAAFSGRGATLILFNDTLLLTAGPNTLDANGNVQLVHQPADSKDPNRATQLDTQRLVVDLADRADLGPMFTNSAADQSPNREIAKSPNVEVDQIDAHGAVRIVDGTRRVNTDHLRYTARDNTAWLWADPGRSTRVTDDRYPAGLSGQSIYWDLSRDRLELRRPGPGLLPIPE